MALDDSSAALTIPSDLALLPLARNFIEAMCRFHHLERSTAEAIVLATSEAVSNVMRHAHRDRPEAKLQIEFHPFVDAIEVVLLDEGDPFNLDAVPELRPGELRIGGRGVFLMRTLMDELTCRPRCNGGNTLRMVKRCTAFSSGRNAI